MSGAGPAELLDVLVVDDAAALCDLLRVALRARQVATANSGPVALRLLLAALLRVKFLVDRLKCDEGIVSGGWREVVREHFREARLRGAGSHQPGDSHRRQKRKLGLLSRDPR